jgi:hypothetical protein
MLEHPADLSVHWVWLPLWHLVHAAFELIGLGFQGVRALSLVASLAAPMVLARALSRELDRDAGPALALSEPSRALAPFIAAAALALAPGLVRAGSSAEPEAVFALLVLAAVSALRSERPWSAGAWLSLAAMLRYEAWPVILAVFAIDALGRRAGRRGATAAWALPLATVLVWCAIHRAYAGSWLWFIRENQAFVARALPRLLPVMPALWRRVLWYPVTIPWFDWGAVAVLLSALGFWRIVRARWWAWAIVPAALVGFVSFAWVRGQHLGLVRHAVAYLPYYAGAMGIGAAVALDRWRVGARARTMLVVAAVAWFSLRAASAASEHRARGERALSDPRTVASALASRARPGAAVFCDDAVVEILSRLPRAQFIRWNAGDIRPYNLSVERARRGDAWVVTTRPRAQALAPFVTVEHEGARLVLLRAR